VFGSLILHRFRELEKVVKEVYRVLRTDGLYLGIEPSLRNPLHLYRQFFADHSPNEFLLTGTRVRTAFTRSGFQAEVRRLAPRFPFVCRLGLATCMGVWAEKE
jgi:ubiquinone/menaquinone biosynthesis C-methylase UbiE